METQAENMKLKGTVYFEFLDDDSMGRGLMEVGNAIKLSVKSEADVDEDLSRRREDYNAVLATTVDPKPPEISLTLGQVQRETLALAFMGKLSEINAGAGTVTGKAVTAPGYGRWIELGHRDITADSVVVKNETGDITYVAGEDYDVHYRLGMVCIKEGGDIAKGAKLLMDYGHGAQDGTRITAGVTPRRKVRIFLDGENRVNGKPCTFNVWAVNLAPATDFDWLSSDWKRLEFTGKAEKPADKESATEIIYKTGTPQS